MKAALVIPAAGASRRYSQAGAVRSKLEEDLGGRPVIQRTIEAFVKHEFVGPLIGCVVVAGPHDEEDFSEFKLRHADRIGLMGGVICRGGVTHRYETVAAALKHLATLPAGKECTHVAIHDAARPCASIELIERVFAAAEKHAAVIPAIEVADTIKRTVVDEDAEEERDPLAAIFGEDGGAGSGGGKKKGLKYATETLDRAGLVQVQTPQIFERAVIERAYAQKDLSSTDDAQLVERLFAAEIKGGADASKRRVIVIDGEPTNIKITRPGDLRLARAVLGVRPPEDKPAHKRF